MPSQFSGLIEFRNISPNVVCVCVRPIAKHLPIIIQNIIDFHLVANDSEERSFSLSVCHHHKNNFLGHLITRQNCILTHFYFEIYAKH